MDQHGLERGDFGCDVEAGHWGKVIGGGEAVTSGPAMRLDVFVFTTEARRRGEAENGNSN